MENVIKLGYNDVELLLPTLTYGSVFVAYADGKTRDWLLECLTVTNRYLGLEVLEESQAKDDFQKPIEGVYRLLHRERGLAIPILTEDDYNVRLYARKAAENRSKVTFNLDSKLFKLASQVAVGNGVRFVTENGFQYFSGESKEMSISKQIDKAYRSGVPSISFDTFDVSIPTIRCYTSNLSTTYGKKFKCKVSGGKVTVWFKELSKKDQTEEKIEKVFLEMEEHSSIQYAIRSFEKVLEKYNIYKKPEPIVESETDPEPFDYDDF
jgi:hypothetical protein